MIEIYSDKSVNSVVEEGFGFVTEAPVPTVEEINQEPEFCAMIISSNEFERVYHTKKYPESLAFPNDGIEKLSLA